MIRFGSADKISTLREKSKVFATPFFFRTRNRETRDTSPSSPTPSYRRSNGIDKEKSPVSSFPSISCHFTSKISFLIPNILAFCQVWLPNFSPGKFTIRFQRAICMTDNCYVNTNTYTTSDQANDGFL